MATGRFWGESGEPLSAPPTGFWGEGGDTLSVGRSRSRSLSPPAEGQGLALHTSGDAEARVASARDRQCSARWVSPVPGPVSSSLGWP